MLQIDSETKAKHLQDKVSRLFHHQLTQLLELVLTNAVPSNKVLKIDRLVLDIGMVNEQNLEQQIIRALKRQLPIILAKAAIQGKADVQKVNPRKSTLELLSFYLKTGYFPWWASESPDFNPDAIIQTSLQQHPQQAKRFLAKNLTNDQSRQRLAYQLSSTTKEMVKTVMAGTEKLAYDWHLNQLDYLHQHVKIRGIAKTTFRKYLDDFLLVYLGQGRDIENNPADFGLSFLENITQKFNISKEEIYNFYQNKIPLRSAGKVERKWLTSIENWTQDSLHGTTTRRWSNVELITTFLQKGIIPTQHDSIADLEDLENMLIELSEEGHTVWVAQLKKLLLAKNIRIRIATQLQDKTKRVLLQLIYGIRNARLMDYLQKEIEGLKKIAFIPPVLNKRLVSFYQDSLLHYYPIYQEQVDFVSHFLVFFSDFLEKNVPLSWENWWRKLLLEEQTAIRQSPVLFHLFNHDNLKHDFVGNLFLPTTDLLIKLEKVEDFSHFFERNYALLKQQLIAQNRHKIDKARLKDMFLELSQTPIFYQRIAPQLNIVEIVNIAKIVLTEQIIIYVKTVQLVQQFLKEHPLPQHKKSSRITTNKLLWLSLLKMESERNYHGSKGTRFWQNWIAAIADLLQISREELWQHFQKIPTAISQTLPDFTKIEQTVDTKQTKDKHKALIINASTRKDTQTETQLKEQLIAFFQKGRLAKGLTIPELDKTIRKGIRYRDKIINRIVAQQIAQANTLKYFRKLAPETIELVHNRLFEHTKKTVQLHFEDFSKIVQHSTTLPTLSVRALQRDIRIGLLHLVAKKDSAFSETNTFVPFVLQVLSHFYNISYPSLQLDFAKVVQSKRFHFSTQVGDFFQAIELPKQYFSAEKSFFYFIQKGVFPLNGAISNLKEMEDWLMAESSQFERQFATTLRVALADEHSLKRVFLQFSSQSVQLLNKLLAQSAITTLTAWVQQFKVFFKQQNYPLGVSNNLDRTMHTGLLQFLLQHPNPPYQPTPLFQIVGKHIFEWLNLQQTEGIFALTDFSEIQIQAIKSDEGIAEVDKLSTTSISLTTLEQSKLEGIFTFLATGSFKQQDTLQSIVQLETVVLHFITHKTLVVWEKWQDLKYPIKAIDRLEDNLSSTSLDLIIEKIGDLIAMPLTKIISTWQQINWTDPVFERKIKKLSTKRVRRIALEVLLGQAKEVNHAVLLVKKLSQAIAQQVNLPLPAFLLKAQPILTNQSLPTFFINLWQSSVEKVEQDSWQDIERTLEITLQNEQEKTTVPAEVNEDLSRLNFYLATQKVPWWILQPNKKTVATIIERNAQQHPTLLKAKLRAAWTNANLPQQVIKAVAKEDWLIIIQHLHGKTAVNWVETIDNVLEIASTTYNLMPTSMAELNTIQWTAMLGFLWTEPAFSEKNFVIFTLEKVLENSNQSIKSWQPIFLQIVKSKSIKASPTNRAKLLHILKRWNKVADKVTPKLSMNTSISPIAIESIENSKQPDLSVLTLEKKQFLGKQQQAWEDLEQIRYFLEFGVIKKVKQFQTKADLVAIIQRQLKKNPQLLKKVLIHLLKNQEAIIRILSQLPPKLIFNLLRIVYGKTINNIQNYWGGLLQLMPGIVNRFNKSAMNGFFRYQLLTYYSNNKTGLFRMEHFFSYLLTNLAKQENRNAIVLLHQFKERLEQKTSTYHKQWTKLLPKIYKLLEDQLEKGQQKLKWDMDNISDDLKKELLYINNAGLAVVAPFFPRYFKMLEMTNEKGVFHDEATAKRAVHLLQYIATGLSETAEPLLVFNKLLCGLPLATPIPKSIELTETEIQVTSDMLSAILAHWKGIGTATIEGLRGGFLIRDGRLEWQEDGYWNLDVEKKSYDVIMQSLPWSVSMIQFPWMDYRIQVTWF